jgi:hypothetical protein
VLLRTGLSCWQVWPREGSVAATLVPLCRLRPNEQQRHQLLVGADAIDKSNRYYELKVHAGNAPNTVSLTASEIERARDADFFLVIVSNVEQGTGTPEVRFIADPLHRLAAVDEGSATVSGVHQAEAFVCRMPLLEPSPDRGAIP